MLPSIPLLLGFWVEFTIFRSFLTKIKHAMENKLQSFALVHKRGKKVLAAVRKHLFPRTCFSDKRTCGLGQPQDIN